MPLPSRSLNATDYRYGFNGMEKDDELKSSGNSYSTYFRQYDPRFGRWMSTDPVTHPHQSPYNAFDGNPIYYADPSGADSEGGGEPKKHKTEKGDTYGELAGKYGVTVEELREWNKYEDTQIPIGVDLIVSDPNKQAGSTQDFDVVSDDTEVNDDWILDIEDGEFGTTIEKTTPKYELKSNVSEKFREGIMYSDFGDYYIVYNFFKTGRLEDVQGQPLVLRDAVPYSVALMLPVVSTGMVKKRGALLWNDIAEYSGRTWQYGKNKFRLDKSGIEHIFTRHHPKYWNGTEKAAQSFLPKNWDVKDIENAVSEVMKQNRTTLANRSSNKGMFSIRGQYQGHNVQVGFKNGKVGQFYTYE